MYDQINKELNECNNKMKKFQYKYQKYKQKYNKLKKLSKRSIYAFIVEDEDNTYADYDTEVIIVNALDSRDAFEQLHNSGNDNIYMIKSAYGAGGNIEEFKKYIQEKKIYPIKINKAIYFDLYNG